MKNEKTVRPGSNPSCPALRSNQRRLFTTILVGLLAAAVVATPAAAQKLTVLHSFITTDGQSPETALVRDNAGNLYGAAFYGGLFENCDNEVGGGTIFKVDSTGRSSVLHFFNNAGDGCFPAGLTIDSAGTLYGAAYNNIFKLPASGNLKVVHNFDSFAQGANPSGPLLRDSAGNIYGATLGGGDAVDCGFSGCGTIFKIDKTGLETVLYTFTGGADGSDPQGGVIRDAAGNLYGTTTLGGDPSCSYLYSQPGCGTAFKLSTAGVLTVLHTFTGGTDGKNPTSGLTMDPAGNLYGVTVAGGNTRCDRNNGCGTVFKIDTAGNETVLHTFANATEGSYISGRLTRDAAGNLYGTAAFGGNSNNDGVVFKLDSHGKETVLHRFSGLDGSGPLGGVILDGAGNLYGTTFSGGLDGAGVVFKLGR